jgi:hypothetical protein
MQSAGTVLYSHPMSPNAFVRPILFALALCMAIAGSIASGVLRGETIPLGGVRQVIELEEEDNSGPGTASSRAMQSSARATSAATVASSCMIRRFVCAKGAASSCYKRWRSTGVSCTDTVCGSGTCMLSDIFFSTYKLEPWDTGTLPAPFPRTETMCIIQSSACPPEDSSCLSPVSLEQVSCDDLRCVTGACTRMSVLVDQTDTIVSQTTTIPTGSSGPSGGDGENQEEGERTGENQESGNGTTSGSSGSGESGTTGITQTTRAVGCFDAAGIWTTDRSRCAVDQKQFVEPTGSTQGQSPEAGTAEEQKAIERKIEPQFVSDTRKSALVQSLLASTVEATGRISRMLESPNLPQDVRFILEQKIEALRMAQQSVSQEEQSVRDLQLLADSVAVSLGEVQQTVTFWMESNPQDFPITVTDKLDRLFASLPSVFGILLQEGIPIESTTMDGYLVAQQTYDAVRGECMADANSCGKLSQVLDTLEPVFAGIRLSLERAGRTDLEQQLDSVLQ